MEPGTPSARTDIAFVVPVWNDASRLASYGPSLAAELAARSLPVRWIIADDGSAPQEHAALAALRDQFAAVYPAVEVHLAASHRGKGAVVREAWSLAPDAAWLAFADADGSVTAREMLDLISRAVADERSTFAARVNTATTRVESNPWRELMHHAYLRVARLWLGLHSTDLQCGAKVVKGDDYRRVAPDLREEGWAFDSEMLLALHSRGLTWQEVPVNWTAQQGGKVRPVRDAIRMFAALWRIKKRLRA